MGTNNVFSSTKVTAFHINSLGRSFFFRPATQFVSPECVRVPIICVATAFVIECICDVLYENHTCEVMMHMRKS